MKFEKIFEISILKNICERLLVNGFYQICANISVENIYRTVVQRCSVKKVFFLISQENTCARFSILINCRPEASTLLKKKSGTGVFLSFL